MHSHFQAGISYFENMINEWMMVVGPAVFYFSGMRC